MPNPRGINQYSKGRGGGKKGSSSKGSLSSRAKTIARKTESSPNFSFHGGATSASHEAFVRSRLAAQSSRKKKTTKKRR